MKEITKEKLCLEFAEACKLAGFNPAKDTLVDTVERFNERKLRHLMLAIDGGGLLVVCADPDMSKRIRKAIERINKDYENEPPAIPQMPFDGCAAFPMPKQDAPQTEFDSFFSNLERAIGGNA